MGQICCSAFPDVDIFNSCGLFSSNKTEGGKEKKLTNKAGGKLALTYTGNVRYRIYHVNTDKKSLLTVVWLRKLITDLGIWILVKIINKTDKIESDCLYENLDPTGAGART